MPQITVPPTIKAAPDSTGTDIQTLPVVGQATSAYSLPVVNASDDPVVVSLAKAASAKGATASVPALLNYIADQGDGSSASEVHLGEVGGNSTVAVATLTRQANTMAYASGQAIQAATAAALVLTCARKNAGTGRVSRARLTKSGVSVTNASFRVHLFRAAPTTLPADAATFTPSGAIDFIGSFDITMDKVFTDGAKGIGVPGVGSFVTFDTLAASQNLYALIEARAAYTPVSAEVFTLALEVDRD